MDCTEAYKEHIMYSFNGFCKVVIRYAAINAWRDRNRRQQREISFEYLTEEKFYPLSTSDEALKSPYEQYPRHNLRSDNHTHQWRACCSPVIFAREKEGNHLPLFFRELHTAGNRGFIRAL